jgi:hypothetical protein
MAEYLRDNSASRISDRTGKARITAGTPWRKGSKLLLPA